MYTKQLFSFISGLGIWGTNVCIIVNQANSKETLYKQAIAHISWTHNLGSIENWMMVHILPTLIFTYFLNLLCLYSKKQQHLNVFEVT